MRYLFLLIFFVFPAVSMQAQEHLITVYGSVIDEEGLPLSSPTVVVAGTSQRVATTMAGTFTARLRNTDSLFVFYPGYKSVYIHFGDTLTQNEYIRVVRLRRMSFELAEAVIRADKPMYEIKKDIVELERKNTNAYKKVSAMSPITMLWEKFSAKEREKRAVAELEYNQEIKEIVANLLRYYVKNDIVDYLEEDDIKLLADEIVIPDYFLKKANDYDLAVFIKRKVTEYLAK